MVSESYGEFSVNFAPLDRAHLYGAISSLAERNVTHTPTDYLLCCAVKLIYGFVSKACVLLLLSVWHYGFKMGNKCDFYCPVQQNDHNIS